MHTMSRINQSNNQSRSAFTLLEMLVVIAIIALLVAITTLVGAAVINTGKKHATQGVIQSLDQALAAYIDHNGDIPPALVEVPYAKLPQQIQDLMPTYNGVKQSAFYPAVDGRGSETASISDGVPFNLINSVALFIESASTVAEVQEIISSIDMKFLRSYSADEVDEVIDDEDIQQPFLLTTFDAWGNPIRYVHPKFDGIIEGERRSLGDAGRPVGIIIQNKGFFVQGALPEDFRIRVRMKFVRRNRLIPEDFGGPGATQGGASQQQLSDFDLLPDSDGGLTVGNRPYFYSAGPDGDPSTIEDNIYSITPQFADAGVL